MSETAVRETAVTETQSATSSARAGEEKLGRGGFCRHFFAGRLAGWRVPTSIGVGVLALATIALAATGASYERLEVARVPSAGSPGGTPVGSRDLREAALTARLARRAPQGLYLVVDTWGNRVRLYRDGKLVREMISSTGSGTFLRDPVTGRTWTFETPRGERRVQRKVRNPVWIKPDWAFIEEGFEPPKSAEQRVDDVSLGDYALYLGDGYLIHGTLFQTLLGRRITHGCIRLGDEDLEYLYRNVPVGTRVYLY